MVEVPWLEWHAAHACNLTCTNCSHLSNNGHTGIVSYDELKQWYSNWNKRISPKVMGILGGEPLLNKQIVDIISMTKDSWVQPKDGIYGVVTNGLLLQRYPDLPKVLSETNCGLVITVHDNSDSFLEKINPNISLAKEWEKEYGIKLNIRNYENWSWNRVFDGWGETLRPFKSSSAKASWDICPVGQTKCVQLYNGNIYKCAPLAYINEHKKHYPNITKDWDKYLDYKPLTPDASDDEIADFYKKKEESYCTMCPDRIIPITKLDPSLPIKYYKDLNKINGMYI